jgi:hypothetical protein
VRARGEDGLARVSGPVAAQWGGGVRAERGEGCGPGEEEERWAEGGKMEGGSPTSCENF